MDLLAQRAVSEALRGNWIEARKINEKILSQDPQNLAALNRLARAYCELGKYKKAETCYKKVLKLDVYNSIAEKALSKIEKITDADLKVKSPGSLSIANANLFIEEPGKTKTISLIHLGDQSIVSMLDAGEQVELVPHTHRVSVETPNGIYIGRLPDDISHTIIRLTRLGNQYHSLIKSVNPECVKIFIRETYRSPTLNGQISFPVMEKSSYVAFTQPDLIHDEKPDVTTTEDLEDE